MPTELTHQNEGQLLATLINVKAAERLLNHFGSLRNLVTASLEDLQRVGELTPGQTDRLCAAIELHQRLSQHETVPLIRSAEDAAALVADMAHLSQEHVRLILVDMNHHVIATPTLYVGTLHGTMVRSAEVFREALLRNCPALIVVHNHPSGDPSPSPEDIELTRMLVAAGKLLDIQVLDHLIISARGWRSLKQLGVAF